MKVNFLNAYKMMRRSAAKEALFCILKQKGWRYKADTFYGLNCDEGQKHSCAHTLDLCLCICSINRCIIVLMLSQFLRVE